MIDVFESAARYWNTLRYLKPIQIANRLWRTIYRPSPSVGSSFSLRRPVAEWIEPARPDSTMRGLDEFEFLSVRRHVRDARDWNEESVPLLWRYHLHYFDDLNATESESRIEWHRALMARWIADNPPASGVGWDPYPTSLRVVNWIKWWLTGEAASNVALQSARLQLAHIMARVEYHLQGNHLLENGRALVFGGLFFEGREADLWLHRGLQILARQLPEQILSDGGHFERSPMYHQITLAGLLDLFNLMRLFGQAELLDLVPHICKMLRWSAIMRHPDGEIALFNDAAFRQSPAPLSLEDYAARLGIEMPGPVESSAALHLTSSGYVRVARDGYLAILNVGSVGPSYQPGHAHADTLSFELTFAGRRLFVDTGTSTYEPGPRRCWERGSGAHNSIVVNGLNSSEVWGGFRVARRARVRGAAVTTNDDITTVVAAHDGYLRLPARVLHERRWEFSAQHMRIADLVRGRGQVTLELILNIHPDFELIQTSSTRFAIRAFDGNDVAVVDIPGDLAARKSEFSFAPRFGVTQTGARIVASARLRLPQLLHTVVRFGHDDGSLA